MPKKTKTQTDKLVVIPTKKYPCNVERYMNHTTETSEIESTSQTQSCTVYNFDNSECCVTIIDTPGLGDTRGPEKDEENTKIIIDKLQTLCGFNAILLIIPINNIRIDTYLKYYIGEIKKMLTKDCEKNLIVVLVMEQEVMKLQKSQ